MLILVRHGRTALNASGRLQGRLDEPLDDLGHLQAKAVAERVGPVDELIASPLLRARQTADAFGMPYSVDEQWLELSYGEYEGAEIGTMPTEVWRKWREDPEFEPVGGESMAALAARVRVACDELLTRSLDRSVAVVSHVSPIKAAVAWALDAGREVAWRTHLSHGSICRIDVRPTGPVLLTFNEAPLTS